jgi:hypothetical protein
MRADGTYEDVVGNFADRKDGSLYPKDAPEVARWNTDPIVPLGAIGARVEEIPVFVGGHELIPAVRGRTVFVTPPKNVKIEWPESP